jgi:hypothetical protein
MKAEFFSPVKQGKLQPSTRKAIAETLRGFEEKRVRIVIERVSAKRSIQQNRYLHLLFTIFADGLNEMGNEFTREQVKEMCKAKFAVQEVEIISPISGEIVYEKRIRGTSEMNKLELMEFIEKVQRWAIEFFGIYLPAVDEQLKADLA